MNTVELDRTHYHLQTEMTVWCRDHFGPNPPYCDWVWSAPKTWEGLGTWCLASAFGTTFFYFKEEADMTAFLLKWQ
jgi:hypothetical protein